MNDLSIQKKIKNHIEIRKPLWTILIVLTGSLATLVFNLDSILKYILFGVGISLDVFIFNSICEHNRIIEKLIKQLEDNNK